MSALNLHQYMILSHVTKIAPPLDGSHDVWQAGRSVHGSRHCLDRDFHHALVN